MADEQNRSDALPDGGAGDTTDPRPAGTDKGGPSKGRPSDRDRQNRDDPSQAPESGDRKATG